MPDRLHVRTASVKVELLSPPWGGRLEARNAQILSSGALNRQPAVVQVR